MTYQIYPKLMKPALDFIIAIVFLVFSSPILIVTTILLFFSNKGKPFFYQRRPGKDEKIFKIIKFKTMNDKKDENGDLLPDDKRITVVGNIVRKTSIDEMLQFINILKGEMSLIGPRPLLPKYLPYYTKSEKKRHDVKPGITGLAQINGRNFLDWDTKLKYDVEYVENISFSNDFKILIKTIGKVLKSKDISNNQNALQPSLDVMRKSKPVKA
ncbi:sugar transferase [Seonamhaeicola sp. ML3]|uniref:sugar transferase n=1 Tax=Seonamhaeicola sp. ML3 TaxID=2937786 RepID=UPI00273A6211|nr:sugar transferase [Seonamhaeicola sp. ML3]